jgi:hypothetical protein
LSKSITASNAPPSLIQVFTASRTASRAGVQAPTRKVSFSNGISVPPKIPVPRACAQCHLLQTGDHLFGGYLLLGCAHQRMPELRCSGFLRSIRGRRKMRANATVPINTSIHIRD